MDWRLPKGVTRMVLVRHGQPVEEMRGRCYGRLDVGLSSAGRLQAERAARFLSEAPLLRIYTSPRQRARESAAPLAELKGMSVDTEAAFREIDFGLFEGLSYEEAEQRYPQVYAEWMAHPTRVRFPEGESYPEMRERVLAAGRELRTRHAGETFVLVSHGGVNRTLLSEALGMPDANLFRMEQGYASVNIIDFYGDEPIVKLMNMTFG
ncbi:alpha-ribazole phosphatase/probable phosphoglycerate mutase [Archangium gephyra]|uniref:Alpha-ribazole phosphatase/probable phosphoglycerate mutase n=1 Tax=Archangium gephyra TaxID=48 RepID=A0AAC8TIT3_9BACT|nr:histidine phosphatase family protein [Archangium gephyra]AKJ07633.1 Alpha-ribazole-5'-phosphate phosphatase [Archangium gephyra]REG29388.1 alpha-ribazole phosphatase/probable phosphoglycerate mutase [Archangium gephyra]